MDYITDKLWEKAENKVFDEEKVEREKVIVEVSDEEVLAAGCATRAGLVVISVFMAAFCLGMMSYFAWALTDVVGGECDASQGRYRDYGFCWNLKENWCAQTQCTPSGQAMGTAVNVGSLDASDPNVCPQGCSVCGTEAGQTEKWIEQLTRFDACRKRTARVRECLPTMDTDGSLANYRGYKTAHPQSQQGAAEAFILRDAFLDACDAQEVYADRRDRGGIAVCVSIAFCAWVWLALTAYLVRDPDYVKSPRKTEMPDLDLWSERKGYVHRFHPRSQWLLYSTANNLFGLGVQLYSFYTPTSTNILIPIFQGAWLTLNVVCRGILIAVDQYTIAQAAEVLFDIGFGIIGFLAVLEPFFEPPITNQLPEVDASLTDYALAVKVFSFLWPLVTSAGSMRELYVDNYWPSPATAQARIEGRTSIQSAYTKLGVFVVQLLAACSVYIIMADPRLCHDFRTCQRSDSCDPLKDGALLGRMPIYTDAEGPFAVISGNKMQRVEMISEDGTLKWRWQINTQTELSFVKSPDGKKAYADLTFAIPNGGIENSVKNPGSGSGENMQGTTPTVACATRFEIQCQETNPRHAFASQTGQWDWVAYNASMYKFVARHDAGATSGLPSCFASDSQWWVGNSMFTAGPGLRVGDSDGEEKLGFIFMEQECDSSDSDKPAGCSNQGGSTAPSCRTKNCLVEPPFVASFAPYGRSSLSSDTLKYTTGAASPSTWETTLHVLELDVSELKLSQANAAASSGGSVPPPPASCGSGPGQTPCPSGGGDPNAGAGGSPPPSGPTNTGGASGGGAQCAQPPNCGTPNVNPPCCTN